MNSTSLHLLMHFHQLRLESVLQYRQQQQSSVEGEEKDQGNRTAKEMGRNDGRAGTEIVVILPILWIENS